jgi:hypothetical protein
MRIVLNPFLADLIAAPKPAGPPPITTTSASITTGIRVAGNSMVFFASLPLEPAIPFVAAGESLPFKYGLITSPAPVSAEALINFLLSILFSY